MARLKVAKAGTLTTIQDLGRKGNRKYGIPQSGAMDKLAMKQANFLVNNPEDFPVVELALQGLHLEALTFATIGLSGAECEVKINGASVEMNRSLKLNAGDLLTIGNTQKGVYAYLAVGGLLKAKKVFGSYATYLMAGFGGLEGRAIRKEDILETSDVPNGVDRSVPELLIPKFTASPVIRIIKGPEWAAVTDTTPLEAKTFRMHASSNRMGIRLTGESIKNDEREIVSSPVVPGTIQLPRNGEPIVLMNDCQTTGGYPRIGKVIDADLDRLAQLRAGQQVKFRPVDIVEAREQQVFRNRSTRFMQ